MYEKIEASGIRQFWTALGKYLSPILSASDEKINWINYKTGVKEIRIRMDAPAKEAFVAIEIRSEPEKRLRFYNIFFSLRACMPAGYQWIETCEDDHGKVLSRIYVELTGFNIFNKEHWPELISFFKAQMILLDQFWVENKEIFEMIS